MSSDDASSTIQNADGAGKDGGADLDEVRRRAYDRYLGRGGEPGDDVGDWLAAERDVRSERDAGESRPQT